MRNAFGMDADREKLTTALYGSYLTSVLSKTFVRSAFSVFEIAEKLYTSGASNKENL